MAEYIDDSGTYGRDARFTDGTASDGVKGTDYDYDATEEAVWFSDSGGCDTDFVLPDIPWVLFEVYAMTGTGITNTLSGSTQLQGKKEWTSDLSAGIASTLSTWKTAYGTPYTTYKVKATHYKTAGGDVADVYFADEGEGFSLTGGTEDGVEDAELILPATSWKMSDALFADALSAPVGLWTAYINFDESSTATPEFTVNTIADIDYTDIPSSGTFVDSNNNTISGMSMTYTGATTGDRDTAFAVGSAGDTCMGSAGLPVESAYSDSTGGITTFKPVLPIGTYNIEVLCSRASSATDKRTTISVDGMDKNIDPSTNNTGSHCLDWTGVVSDGSTSLDIVMENTVSPMDTSSYLSAIKFVQTDTETVDLTTNLTNHYPLNSTDLATDTVGSLDGSATGMTYSATYGIFNGTTAFIEILEDTYEFADVTISFNFRLHSITRNQGIFAKALSSLEKEFYTLSDATADMYLAQEYDDNGHKYVFETDLANNTWYHMVYSIDEFGNCDIYMDGVFVGNSVPPNLPTLDTLPVCIGKADYNSVFLEGDMSEVRAYSGVVSPKFAEAIYTVDGM